VYVGRVPLANITGYEVGNFIHILAVVAGIGPTYAYGPVLAYVERFAPQSVPAVYTAFQRVDRIMVTPGLIIILLAGLYMVSDASISLGESWVSLGLATVIILLGLTHAYFAPRWRRGIELAERDLAGSGELSEEFRANSKQTSIAGALVGLLVIVTIFFMVTQP
jgi:uncharacterized membrane protein